MQSFIDDLMAADPASQREAARARLRVAVAESLLLRMEAMDMTKAQLAAALGVSRSAVSQALTGTRNMSLNLLADMAAALGLSARVVLQAEAAAGAAAIQRSRDIQTTANGTLLVFNVQTPTQNVLRAIPIVGTSTSVATGISRNART